MKNNRIEVPFTTHPMIRMIIRVDESHDDDGVTIIDRCEIEEIFVSTKR